MGAVRLWLRPRAGERLVCLPLKGSRRARDSVIRGRGASLQRARAPIHALVMVTVIKVARIADKFETTYRTFRLMAVMIAAVTAP